MKTIRIHLQHVPQIEIRHEALKYARRLNPHHKHISLFRLFVRELSRREEISRYHD